MTDRIAVIGGGLGGLAAACTLAGRGYAVTLFEKSDWLGGKAAVLNENGFRFDMGPTILTVPRVLDRIFREANRRLTDYLKLIPLDPQWRCIFADGSMLDLLSDTEKMSASLDRFAPGSSAGYQRFMKLSKRLHKISDQFFFWRSVGGMRDVFDFKNSFSLGTLTDVWSLKMGQSVSRVVRKHVPDTRVAQMIDHFTQYVGSSPEQSPAVLCGIAHMQTADGVWYPQGGTGAVPAALSKLLNELEVEIQLGVGIDRIETDGNEVSAVITNRNDRIEVGAVVSNMDTVRTHRELLKVEAATSPFMKRRPYEPACSGVVLYLGLKKRYEHLLHHNFVFSQNPHDEFEWIYKKGEPAPDPTCYVCAPACTEPSVAPPGGEALYVLVHTPYLRPHHDWKTMLPAYRKTILNKLATTGGMKDLEKRIVFERVLTPQDIHDRYRVLNGAIYGLASHGKFNGAFKPANLSPDTRGLYLAGGSAHPGPGMPMALMSGWIAADTLDMDRKMPPIPSRPMTVGVSG
jgi:diapolycopene oxygenase